MQESKLCCVICIFPHLLEGGVHVEEQFNSAAPSAYAVGESPTTSIISGTLVGFLRLQ